MYCCDEQEMLVSLLDVRDLLALRLVSLKTKDWVNDVMSKHRSKTFTLHFNEKNTLDKLMGEQIDGIPFVRGLNIKHLSFFSHPLIPSFLRIYGPQIHTVSGYSYGDHVASKEIAFYKALPKLTQLSTRWLGDNAVDLIFPALERLQLFKVPSTSNERSPGTDLEFLHSFPNLRHLRLSISELSEYLEVLSAFWLYFAIRNRWEREERSSRKPFTIVFDTPCAAYYNYQLNETTEEGCARLLKELAVADGRILIENMPVSLLDEAVRLFHHQQGGKLLLRSFGKCIRSLLGFSSSVYEVELPNMRRSEVYWAWEGTKARDGDYSRTVSWPKLEEVKLEIDISMENDVSYVTKLVFGSGVLRSSVKRLDFDLNLLCLESKEDHLLLANFPNLTHLTLRIKSEEVRLLHSLMRVLPTSCPKIQFLCLFASFPLGDEDFLGVDGEGGLTTTPPLLQFPGKLRVYKCGY
jgi:hypothetical protein